MRAKVSGLTFLSFVSSVTQSRAARSASVKRALVRYSSSASNFASLIISLIANERPISMQKLQMFDLHHVLAGEQDSLPRQCQLLVELADLGVEHAKCGRQPRTMDFYRGQHSAELLARKLIGQFLYQSLRTFDWRKEWVHRWSHLEN